MYKFITTLLILILSSSSEARFRHQWPDFEKLNVVMSDQQRARQWQNGHGPLVNDEFQEKLNFITDSQVTEGNRALLLVNGMMSYKVRYQLSEKAKHSIVISVLSIHPKGKRKGPIEDIYTKHFVDALIKAKRGGVEVKLIYDGMTSYISKTQKVMNLLLKEGITVIKYNPYGSQRRDLLGFFPLDALNILRKFTWRRWIRGEYLMANRWHDKTIIIDGKYAIMGGLNWGDYYGAGNQFSAHEYKFSNFLERPLSQEIGLDKIYQSNHGWGQLMNRGWRDTDVLVTGPVVPIIQTQILKDILRVSQMMKRKKYKFQKISPQIESMVDQRFNDNYRDNPVYFPNTDDGDRSGLQVRYIYQRPFLQRDHQQQRKLRQVAKQQQLLVNQKYPQTYISNYYLNMINHAKKQILWGSFSLVARPQMKDALVRAAKRGVKIYLITNSRKTAKGLGDKGFITYRRNKKTYKSLLNKGVVNGVRNIRIFEWQDKKEVQGRVLYSGAFHSKNMDIDGVISVVGPYNLSHASFDHHAEGVVAISSPEFSKENQEMFQKDLLYTKEVRIK